MLKRTRYVQRSRAASLRSLTAGPSLVSHPHNRMGNSADTHRRAQGVGITPDTLTQSEIADRRDIDR